PAWATTRPLTVTGSDGTATSATSFVVIPPPAVITVSETIGVADAPAASFSPTAILGFTPASGPIGTSVVVTGINLNGATSVTFNGTSAEVTDSSASALTATVPAGATTGRIAVTAPSGTAASPTSFPLL